MITSLPVDVMKSSTALLELEWYFSWGIPKLYNLWHSEGGMGGGTMP